MTLRTSIFMSLDNRVDADGEWQYPWFDEEFFSVISTEWDRADAFLVGGRSFAGYERLAFEHPDSPMVGLLGAKPVVVASRTRTGSEAYPGATFVADLEPDTVGRIEQEFGAILVLGSPASVVSMIESGALPTLNLTVIPTVVGTGPTLFESATGPISFTPAASRTLGSGVILLDLAVA